MSKTTFHKELYNCTGPYYMYMQVHKLAVYTNGFVQALYMHTYVYIIILSSAISPWMICMVVNTEK